MRHTAAQLLDVVYHFYSRGDDPEFRKTQEYGRLSAARKRAGSPPDYEHWRDMVARVGARFPDCNVQNWSFHLLTGDYDGGYRGTLTLPDTWTIGFYVSFLVPYYVVYKRSPGDKDIEATLYFPESEQPYADGTADEIRAIYPGYEPMPYEIGSIVVPDVAREIGGMGATLYDLLFSPYDRLAMNDEDRQNHAAFLKAYPELTRRS